MEIEVEEYVRTTDGNIDKVIAILEDNIGLEKHKWCSEKYIVKHSKNIIDLIEVGDYVNGEKVRSILDITDNEGNIIGKRLTTEYRIAQFTGLDNRYYLYEQDIRTIVTHEQMSSIEYKV